MSLVLLRSGGILGSIVRYLQLLFMGQIKIGHHTQKVRGIINYTSAVDSDIKIESDDENMRVTMKT